MQSVYDMKPSLTLETWYAGTLTLPRTCVQSVATLLPADIVFEGPSGVEGWTRGGQGFFDDGTIVNPAAWQFKAGAFQASSFGGIGGDIKLPPISNIEFDLLCQGCPQFNLQFYTERLDRAYGGNAYEMHCNKRMIYLRRYPATSILGKSVWASCQTTACNDSTIPTPTFDS
jgi:hypothetical protein